MIYEQCGVNVFLLFEATTDFAMNGKIYLGREAKEETSHRNLSNDLVINLYSVYFETGRDIYLDRYFRSHNLVCILLHQNLKLVGTVMANQREVPSQLKSRGREVESTKAFNAYMNKIFLLSYDPKQNRNILIMSFSQPSVSITDCHKKPTVVIDHNKYTNVGGVGTLDEN